LDWQGRYPGAVMAPSREALARHLDALLANPLPTVPLDDALVAAARATFSRVPPATRAYSLIAPSAAAQSIPPWRPADALGAGGVGVFVRATGKPLTEGVPGFYTVDGFHKVLLPALGYATKQVSSESWVLGTRSELAPNSAAAPQPRPGSRRPAKPLPRRRRTRRAPWCRMRPKVSPSNRCRPRRRS